MKTTTRVTFIFIVIFVVSGLAMVSSAYSQAEDARSWKNWGGPSGSFSASVQPGVDFGSKPKLIWEQEIGQGHSAIVDDGTHCYCQFSKGKSEIVRKLDLKSGALIWETSYPVTYQSSRYPGPHATPSISGGFLVTTSIDGVVRAFNLVNGVEAWAVDLRKTFGMELPQSGYASSPLVINNLVLVPTLGEARGMETESFARPGVNSPPGMVALRLVDGRTVWKSDSFRSSHASPLKFEIDGRTIVCLQGMFELIGLDPLSGEITWTHRLRESAADNVSFSPIWDPSKSQFLVSHGYCEKGTQAIGVSYENGKWKTRLNWTNRDLRVVHTNAVLTNGMIVGTGRDPSNILVGIRCADGKTVFRKRGLGKTNFVRANSVLVGLSSRGELRGGVVNEGGLEVAFKVEVSEKKTWTLPSISGPFLLCRVGEKLFAFRFPNMK